MDVEIYVTERVDTQNRVTARRVHEGMAKGTGVLYSAYYVCRLLIGLRST